MSFFITSVNDNFGIRGLISDQMAYTLNARIASYTKQNRTSFISMFSGHTQGAYEKLQMYKIYHSKGHGTNGLTFFMVRG